MSRPYGYVGRPRPVRLSRRARHWIDAATVLGVIVACYAATLALPTVAPHLPGIDPQPAAQHVPARPPAHLPDPTPTLPACPMEDSPGPCHWDALHQGNGRGRSFTVDAHGHVTYDDGRPNETR